MTHATSLNLPVDDADAVWLPTSRYHDRRVGNAAADDEALCGTIGRGGGPADAAHRKRDRQPSRLCRRRAEGEGVLCRPIAVGRRHPDELCRRDGKSVRKTRALSEPRGVADADARAAFGVYDSGALAMDIHRAPYDVAGAQAKTALLFRDGRWGVPSGSTPTTHILKLPLGLVGGMGLDLRESVENEWLCAQILAAYGLPVTDRRAHV